MSRFRREAEAVARLQHPHIVQIHEISEQDGRPCFSMELVSGGSLARRLDGTSMNLRAAAVLVETLAHAVHAAHERGIIRRDSKPANILLQERFPAEGAEERGGKAPSAPPPRYSASPVVNDYIPRITDFGLAKQVVTDGPAGEHTRSGTILGSLSYMPPEQAQANPAAVGPATDVYSLGAIRARPIGPVERGLK